jgi:hypothetical protein
MLFITLLIEGSSTKYIACYQRKLSSTLNNKLFRTSVRDLFKLAVLIFFRTNLWILQIIKPSKVCKSDEIR